MSDLKRFDMNGVPHINGNYCDANDAILAIKELQSRIETLQLYDMKEAFLAGANWCDFHGISTQSQRKTVAENYAKKHSEIKS